MLSLTLINPQQSRYSTFRSKWHYRSIVQMMHAVVCALTVGSSEISWARATSNEFSDGIAVIVNNKVITISEVRETMQSRAQKIAEVYDVVARQKRLKNLKNAVMRDLIDRQLILEEFQKCKLTLSSRIADEHIREIIHESGDRSAFIQALHVQGYTLTQLKKIETEKVIVAAMCHENVKDDFFTSPIQIWRYYLRNKGAFTSPVKVKLRMIVLRGDGDGASPTASKKEKGAMAKEIRAKLVNGEKFDRVARLYSEDVSTKNAGGDWGWIERTTLNADLSNLVFSMKPGEISPVISIGRNYYIVLVEARKHASVKGLSEVCLAIEERLIQQERITAQNRWLESLRKKAYVKTLI